MRTAEERLSMMDEIMCELSALGLIMRTPDDEPLDGRVVSLDGHPQLNFSSCSYLGLELDPRMRSAVCDAVMRYGTQFSSSRAYLSAPLYPELEARLGDVFGGHVLVAPSTTMGHIAALPVLVGSRDAVVIDQQVHHSVQTAVTLLRPQGTTVEMIRHNHLASLEDRIARLSKTHERIWYLADGVYSMFADFAPFAQLSELLARHEQLHLYIDDSHGVSWSGTNGRGPALEQMGLHERMVVAASLNKSFAAAGGALIFPDAESMRRVRMLGGPFIFSGPIQPPMLGAAVQSARIHASAELAERQAALRERIQLCTELMQEFCLPLASTDHTPIRYVTLGLPRAAQQVAARLMAEGIYVNVAMFPAVPMRRSGVRFTLTLHHRPQDIRRLVDALARHVPAVLAEMEGHSARAIRPAVTAAAALGALGALGVLGAQDGTTAATVTTGGLRLERHGSIADLDGTEWDSLLGGRGTFDAAGLAFLEDAFGHGERPQDEWGFHYYIVRDERGAPVLATFFTCALWKDDMLSSAAVSRRVEERRRDNPYYLTSMTFAMGSLLTEGDHLYLDRSRDWRGALHLLSDAIAADAQTAGAPTIVLRDFAPSDGELNAAMRENGFVKLGMPDSLVIDDMPPDDERWLAGLSSKARVHQRRDVLPYDAAFEVQILSSGGPMPTPSELDHLHELYRNVRERSLEINSFELPRNMLDKMLAHPCWELVLLRRRERAGAGAQEPPVAFGAHFIGAGHYAPMIVGLDYEYVRSHHSYRQALRQALLRARTLGAHRVLFGMGAALEKRRFGAHAEARCVFAQASDHFSAEVLATIEAEVMGAAA